MKRLDQAVLIISLIALSWLAMQAVHELGHVLGAWVTGARVTGVVLDPLTISRTDVADNTRPTVVVWAGPIVGAGLPLVVFLLAKVFRAAGVYLLRFFAGFCLIANGAYIAFGPGDGWADTGVMIRHGSPRAVMVLFGLVTIPLGLYLWHGQGSHFGLGEAKGKVDRRAAWVCAMLLVVLVVMEWVAC